MDIQFSTNVNLTTLLVDYLHLKEIASLKQVCSQQSSSVSHKIPYWFQTVRNQYDVSSCGICSAIRSSLKIEHCPMCEENICIDHLEICDSCNNIYCYRCRGFCC